jgi:hypothetical protein
MSHARSQTGLIRRIASADSCTCTMIAEAK